MCIRTGNLSNALLLQLSSYLFIWVGRNICISVKTKSVHRYKDSDNTDIVIPYKYLLDDIWGN